MVSKKTTWYHSLNLEACHRKEPAWAKQLRSKTQQLFRKWHLSAFLSILQFPVNVTRMSHSECGKLSRVSIYSFSPQKFIFHSIYFHYQYRGKLVITDYENSKNVNAGGEQLVLRLVMGWRKQIITTVVNNSPKNIKVQPQPRIRRCTPVTWAVF